MNKILWITVLILTISLSIVSSVAMRRGEMIKNKDSQICKLQSTIDGYIKMQETYAEAEKQAKEFEKELAKDENSDNLDIVPDKYILDQLHTD